MKIDARHGNTAREFRPFTDAGSWAAVLDGIEVGSEAVIREFVKTDGSTATPRKLQMLTASSKAPGSHYRTRITHEGLRIWRLA